MKPKYRWLLLFCAIVSAWIGYLHAVGERWKFSCNAQYTGVFHWHGDLYDSWIIGYSDGQTWDTNGKPINLWHKPYYVYKRFDFSKLK